MLCSYRLQVGGKVRITGGEGNPGTATRSALTKEALMGTGVSTFFIAVGAMLAFA